MSFFPLGFLHPRNLLKAVHPVRALLWARVVPSLGPLQVAPLWAFLGLSPDALQKVLWELLGWGLAGAGR